MKRSLKSYTRQFKNLFSGNPKSCHSAQDVEIAEHRFYDSFIRPDMVIFDVGSNIGSVSAYFAKRLSNYGSLHCFEPGNSAFKQLKNNIHNKYNTNVFLNNFAIGDFDGETSFHLYPESHSSWNSIHRRPLENYGISVEVEQVVKVPISTLDTYCSKNRINKIDLLKLDLEGSELQALIGAKEMLRNSKIEICIFEFGQTTFDQGNSPDALVRFWQNYNYTLSNVIPYDPLFPGGRSSKTAQFAMVLAKKSDIRKK